MMNIIIDKLVLIDVDHLQNVVLGIVALFVPIGIAILNYYLNDNSGSEQEKTIRKLELYYILDNILRAKLFVLSTIFILFVFALSKYWSSLIIVDIFLLLIYLFKIVIPVLAKVREWFYSINDRYLIAIGQLDTLFKTKEPNKRTLFMKSYEALFRSNLLRNHEEALAKKLQEHLNDSIINKDFSITMELLLYFERNLKNRPPASLVYDYYAYMLDLYYYFLKNESEDSNSSSSNFLVSKNELSIICLEMFFSTWQSEYWDLFKKLNDFLDKVQKELVDPDKKIRIMGSYLTSFCYRFFDSIVEHPQKYDVWKSYFIQKSLVTVNNIRNKNMITNIFLRNYLDWVQPKILNNKTDPSLEEVSYNLFPETDPSAWSKILLLCLYRFDMKNIILAEWKFGFIGRMVEFSWTDNEENRGKPITDVLNENDEKKWQEHKNNTYELALLIFGYILKIENINKAINELDNLILENDFDGTLNIKRGRLKTTLQEMANYIELKRVTK